MSTAQKLADALVGPAILVQVKHDYGQRRIYPICKRAVLFADMAGTKTISDMNIARIKELGYTIDNLPEVP